MSRSKVPTGYYMRYTPLYILPVIAIIAHCLGNYTQHEPSLHCTTDRPYLLIWERKIWGRDYRMESSQMVSRCWHSPIVTYSCNNRVVQGQCKRSSQSGFQVKKGHVDTIACIIQQYTVFIHEIPLTIT